MLVIEYKLVTIEYFMDELQTWECNEILNSLEYADLPSWEQTRQILFGIVQVNSKKKLKPTDLIKFAWDNDRSSGSKEITKDDIKRLEAKAQAYLKNKNTNK